MSRTFRRSDFYDRDFKKNKRDKKGFWKPTHKMKKLWSRNFRAKEHDDLINGRDPLTSHRHDGSYNWL